MLGIGERTREGGSRGAESLVGAAAGRQGAKAGRDLSHINTKIKEKESSTCFRQILLHPMGGGVGGG